MTIIQTSSTTNTNTSSSTNNSNNNNNNPTTIPSPETSVGIWKTNNNGQWQNEPNMHIQLLKDLSP